MTKRFEELLWTELDGDLSAEETAELAELRATGDDGKDSDTGIELGVRDLAVRLAEVEDLDVPAALRGRILAAIEESPRTAMPAMPAMPAKASRPPFQPRRTRPILGRWGYLAAALLVALVASWLTFGPTPGPERASELVGTVTTGPGSVPEPSSVEPPIWDDSQAPTTPEYVRLEARDGHLEASLDLRFGSASFVFSSPGLEVEQIDFWDGATGSYESDSGQVALRVTGPGRVELVLGVAEPDRPFTLSAFGDGIEPFEGAFTLRQLSGS